MEDNLDQCPQNSDICSVDLLKSLIMSHTKNDLLQLITTMECACAYDLQWANTDLLNRRVLTNIMILLNYGIEIDRHSLDVFLHYRFTLDDEMTVSEFLRYSPNLDNNRHLYDSIFKLHPQIIDYILKRQPTDITFYLYNLYLSYHDDDYHYNHDRLSRTFQVLISYNPNVELEFPITKKIKNPPIAKLKNLLSNL